jgi:hypothetical protein
MVRCMVVSQLFAWYSMARQLLERWDTIIIRVTNVLWIVFVMEIIAATGRYT